MAENLDTLQISISATSKTAVKNLEALERSLNKLGSTLSKNINSTKLDSVAGSFTKIAEATREFGRSTRAINNLPKLTQNLSDMVTQLSNAPSVSANVVQLASAISQLSASGTGLKATASAIRSTMNAGSNLNPGSGNRGDNADSDEERKAKEKEVFDNFTLAGEKFKSVLSNIKKGIAGIIAKIKEFRKEQSQAFSHGLKFLLKYIIGVRSFYALVNKIKSAIAEGNKNLVKYSQTFNESMSNIKSAMGMLQNSVSVAFAPIVNAISQAISDLIVQFAEAFNTIARFFATLTGAKTVVQATKYYQDYAKSLDKASKSAKALAIDELNIIDGNKGGGAGSVSTEKMFETVDVTDEFVGIIDRLKEAFKLGDATLLGKDLGEGIINALNSIPWKNIQEKATNTGKLLATFINGAIESEVKGETFGHAIGSTIGNGIQTGINFFYSTFKELHWGNIGQMFVDGLKGVLDNVDARQLGETVSLFVNGVMTALTTFFSDEKAWSELGQKIGDFFSGINWKETWFNLKELVKSFFGALKMALWSWAQTDEGSLKLVSGLALAFASIKTTSFILALGGTSFSKTIATSLAGAIDVTALAGSLSGVLLAGFLGAILVMNYKKIAEAITKKFAEMRGDDPNSVWNGLVESNNKVNSENSERAEKRKQWFEDLANKIRGVKEESDKTDTSINNIKDTLEKAEKPANNLSTSFDALGKNVGETTTNYGKFRTSAQKKVDFNVDTKNLLKVNSVLVSIVENLNKIAESGGDTGIRAVGMASIPKFAIGGFPEDGLFMANHSEIVGKFSNGKTAVANNQQIVEGISAGVQQAVAQALVPYLADISDNTRRTADKPAIDGKAVFRTVQNYATDYSKRTGQNAFA